MLEFEVRHWITNHEADIGTPGFGGDAIPGFLGPPGHDEKLNMGGNTVGDIFYGSKGYMAITNEEDYQSYRTWLGKEQDAGTDGLETREQLGQLY